MTPEEFESPSGNCEDFEFNNRRADSQALAPTTKALAKTLFSVRVALSMYETASALPVFPIAISRAIAPVTSVNLPVFSAYGIITWLELKLDALMHPRPPCPQ